MIQKVIRKHHWFHFISFFLRANGNLLHLINAWPHVLRIRWHKHNCLSFGRTQPEQLSVVITATMVIATISLALNEFRIGISRENQKSRADLEWTAQFFTTGSNEKMRCPVTQRSRQITNEANRNTTQKNLQYESYARRVLLDKQLFWKCVAVACRRIAGYCVPPDIEPKCAVKHRNFHVLLCYVGAHTRVTHIQTELTIASFASESVYVRTRVYVCLVLLWSDGLCAYSGVLCGYALHGKTVKKDIKFKPADGQLS